MKIINRGYMIVRAKSPFWDWANKFDDSFGFLEEDEVEPNIYLITEDFFEIEPLIEQNFKKIFTNELSMVSDNEEDWPKDRTQEIFLEWFDLEFGSTVFDLEKSDLKVDKI